MSNFSFIQSTFPAIFDQIKIAEQRTFTEPISAASYIRRSLEACIHMMYDEHRLDFPYNTSLDNLIRELQYENLIPSVFGEHLKIIRKTGNAGSHFGQKVKGREVMISLQYFFGFAKWFAEMYADTLGKLPTAFDKSLVPKVGSEARKLNAIKEEMAQENDKLKAQLAKMMAEMEASQQAALASEEAMKALQEEKAQIQAKLAEKKEATIAKISSEFSEAETRTHLIDIDLKEAGWGNLVDGRDTEYHVTGMPITSDNPKGNGYVDYVLWGDNGLPLALIEAKRTSVASESGRHQATLYADCLEKQFGVRPLIFYTNGYETYLYDDLFYSAPRRVYGFYTKEELLWEVEKRKTRKDIRNPKVNTEISGRPYQIEAIQRVGESLVTDGDNGLRGHKRTALLVMATGSGKTRTAASIVDILYRHNWIKRVLFLADRNALVKQAKKAFAEHLPELSSVNLTNEKEDNTTRLVFSTYQSVINKIDSTKIEGERFYGVGHFDLIVVDEAHRSVYNKYGVIFEYFDALLLGLTATPKSHVDFNTYELFECSDGNPTFAYELDDAVKAGYLNPYKNEILTTKFMSEGIKYSELSPKDKAEYEKKFRDESTGQFPENIRNSAINRWLFNKDTVYKILDGLMTKGLKIEGGDKLGRTIIFAANQHHAKFIVECCEQRYPDLPSGFIKMVHNKVSHAQGIIEAFCDHHKELIPQIAVSVDMMDTGIDAPRVLNLVFFKQVRSYAKFWQMIGRGTRLCPDVYGPGQAKDKFLIFDVCGNFEFFEEKPQGHEGTIIKPITQQIFETRLSVARLQLETGEEDHRLQANEILDILHGQIKSLNRERFDVQMHRQHVDQYQQRQVWNNLTPEHVHDITTSLSALPSPETINDRARRFDLMMLKYMQSDLLMNSKSQYVSNLIEIATELSKKYTIKQVAISKALIETMQDPDFYKKLSQRKIEEIRQEIRELIQYLDTGSKPIIYTDIDDNSIELSITAESPVSPISNTLYKRQVERYIRENKHHVTISKLNTNAPITEAEIDELQRILFDGGERGTLDTYQEVYGDQPLGKFIRSIVGLDIQVAQELFSDFLQAGNMTADQMKFVDNIVQHLNRNGIIDKQLLFQSPFNEAHSDGLLGVFDDREATKIISLIDTINQRAEVG